MYVYNYNVYIISHNYTTCVYVHACSHVYIYKYTYDGQICLYIYIRVCIHRGSAITME